MKEPKDTLPAALTWIEEEIASGHYRSNRTLEAGYDYLICALPRDVFAGALVAILWPEQTLAESMEDVLDDDARNLHYFRVNGGAMEPVNRVCVSRIVDVTVFRKSTESADAGGPEPAEALIATRHSE